MTTGLCECGCGQPTRIATKTDLSTDRLTGRPMRFLHGHRKRTPKGPNPNPEGLCLCGCGKLAPLANKTDRRSGARKGFPQRFIEGHTSGH